MGEKQVGLEHNYIYRIQHNYLKKTETITILNNFFIILNTTDFFLLIIYILVYTYLKVQ